MRDHRLRDKDGLTMLEMIVALAILAFGIIGVLRAFSSSVTTCREAESYSVAAGLAQQVAAELERKPDLDAGRLSGTFAGTDSGYSWEAVVEPAGTAGLLRANIVVKWNVGQLTRHCELAACIRPREASQ